MRYPGLPTPRGRSSDKRTCARQCKKNQEQGARDRHAAAPPSNAAAGQIQARAAAKAIMPTSAEPEAPCNCRAKRHRQRLGSTVAWIRIIPGKTRAEKRIHASQHEQSQRPASPKRPSYSSVSQDVSFVSDHCACCKSASRVWNIIARYAPTNAFGERANATQDPGSDHYSGVVTRPHSPWGPSAYTPCARACTRNGGRKSASCSTSPGTLLKHYHAQKSTENSPARKRRPRQRRSAHSAGDAARYFFIRASADDYFVHHPICGD